MTIHYQDEQVTVHHGDCIEVMRSMPENSIDAIVTDPPYGLGFMGKKWDALPPGEEWARECLRVLKPGGHLIAFGGSRTWHRLAVAVEDAGFEIRDGVLWIYGSGFPKSHDVSKAIDKIAGAERPVVGVRDDRGRASTFGGGETRPTLETSPSTPEAAAWDGWGTALKPGYEPAVMARKPFAGTVAANVLEHGVGAINIDASRIATDDALSFGSRQIGTASGIYRTQAPKGVGAQHVAGRWPSNVILDEHAAKELDTQSGVSRFPHGHSRFFYVAKAPKSERPVAHNVTHPTVKPLTLMRYLIKLVTPVGGTVLDTFAGSGTTLEAAILEGYKSIGIEQSAEYLPLIDARIKRAKQ